MKTILKLGLVAVGAYLVLQKLGFSLPTLPGAEPEASGSIPTSGSTAQTVPGAQPAAAAVFKARLDARAKQENRSTFNWWEWSWLVDAITGKEYTLPAAETFGLTGEALAIPMTLDEFWAILSNGYAAGISTGVPGLSGVRRATA
jgi:hypothetical protein